MLLHPVYTSLVGVILLSAHVSLYQYSYFNSSKMQTLVLILQMSVHFSYEIKVTGYGQVHD